MIGAAQSFAMASERTQARFWTAIRRRSELEHLRAQAEAEAEEHDLPVCLPVGFRVPPLLRWDDRWRRRAYRDSLADRRGLASDETFDGQRERLLAIETDDYVQELTGEEIVARKVRCPARDERTASLHSYGEDRGWYCWACSTGGDIYDLGAHVWGLATSGADFREIHDRLCGVFL